MIDPDRLRPFTRGVACSLLAGALALVGCDDKPAPSPEGEPAATVKLQTSSEAPLEEKEVEESKVKQPDLPKIQDPVDTDHPPSDHNETANEEQFAESKGRSDARSDAKFNNDAIGAGGGAGGAFGARRGGAAAIRAKRAKADSANFDATAKSKFVKVADKDTSTFSADVDGASYGVVRGYLRRQQLPPEGSVRIEEMINYFDYDYGGVERGAPFAVDMEVAGCPWSAKNRIVRIGIKAPIKEAAKRPDYNLVFLLDVSGSMRRANKLPLVIFGMKRLIGALEATDKVGIVTYAGRAALVRPSAPIGDKKEVLAQLDNLWSSGGGTNGAEGIKTAYELARGAFAKDGVNRVVLATDGDFNVGVRDRATLVELINREREQSSIYLTILGAGVTNLRDGMMEDLSNKCDGNYFHLDSEREARRVLVDQLASTVETVAKDLKLQVQFNPAKVSAYRLIGYDNRRLANKDFDDDTKDAGDIGPGHTVTALYEVVPADGKIASTMGDDLLQLRLRWKQPKATQSTKIELGVKDSGKGYARATADFKWALAVAELGMLLRGSEEVKTSSLSGLLELAQAGLAPLPQGPRKDLEDREELVRLMKWAQQLAGKAEKKLAEKPAE